jgi:uncharacterized protein
MRRYPRRQEAGVANGAKVDGGRIVVTGATGLIGRALGRRIGITAMARKPGEKDALWWDPGRGEVHDDGQPVAAVVHLAGENLAAGRWTAERRQRIERSRLQGTLAIVRWIAERRQRPSVLICASAVGIYGDTGEQERTETDPPGSGFLAVLCQRWEREAARAEDIGVRVVHARFGVVLSREGGALKTMDPLFRLGLGGPLGGGRQWFPWIHVDDVTGAILWLLEAEDHAGAYNLVAPGIVRQGDFARALGAALRRPALLPAPAFALRAVLGPMADEALLVSQRVAPGRLLSEGYGFAHPELEDALGDLYRKR